MSTVTEYAKVQKDLCVQNDRIKSELFEEYGVKKGLRDLDGHGVLTGLTNISHVMGFKTVDGKQVPCDGELLYRGYDVTELVKGCIGNRYIFEEGAYLLLFGQLPTKEQLSEFENVLYQCMTLPKNFTREVIMKASSSDIMNSMTRSILTLASYDSQRDNLDLDNVLRQCLQLIGLFPMLAVYGYHAYNHYDNDGSMYIHRPKPNLSLAENLLQMLRPDMKFTDLEAQVLDIALLLHMEHGGGNNSTFTTRVVSSSGTDTYSAIAAALGSLKGPKHGGANIKVVQMMENIKENISDWSDEEEISAYLASILNKEAFDRSGLIYGMGHAVYSLSDPRAEIFKLFVKKLCDEKGMEKEYLLYSNIEKLAPHVIEKSRKMYKGVSANIDFYSGFVYSMLGLPLELYTPIFAMARISGWSAHRIEELVNAGKIIRPSYKCVQPRKEYRALANR